MVVQCRLSTHGNIVLSEARMWFRGAHCSGQYEPTVLEAVGTSVGKFSWRSVIPPHDRALLFSKWPWKYREQKALASALMGRCLSRDKGGGLCGVKEEASAENLHEQCACALAGHPASAGAMRDHT